MRKEEKKQRDRSPRVNKKLTDAENINQLTIEAERHKEMVLRNLQGCHSVIYKDPYTHR